MGGSFLPPSDAEDGRAALIWIKAALLLRIVLWRASVHPAAMAELAFSPRSADCRPSTARCAQCAARPFSVCAAVPDADLARLEALAETIVLEKGRAAVREGDAAVFVHNVAGGSLRLSRLMRDGRRQVLGFAFTGDFLGLDGAASYGWTAEALEPTRLCRFSRPRFDALVAERPDLGAALRTRVGEALTAAQAQILLLGRKTALERVASFLLALPDCDPARPSAVGGVRLSMTRSDIADYLGLTLESVSRTLSRLKRQGLIEQISLSEMAIVRPDALRALAGD